MNIQVQHLSFAYGPRQVLQDISFQVPSGSVLAVLGPNGSGKTTLFRCMLGLLNGYTGDTLIEGSPVRGLSAGALARRISYVPQSNYPSFNYSVQDMVLMGTTASLSGFAAPGEKEAALAAHALATLGIQHLVPRGFMQISGGERQLVLVARALAQGAKLIIMDEPTANLDFGNGLRVMEQIKALAASGYTILLSTHNPDHALWYASSVLALANGQLLGHGPPAQTLTGPLVSQLYGIPVRVETVGGRQVCIPSVLS